MSNSHHHQMHLEKTHPSGAEEWHCPTCGRRFLLNWQPYFKRIMLDPGDEHVSHSGGKGGLQMGLIQIETAEEEPQMSDELRQAIEDALAHIDFDDWDDDLDRFA